MRIAHSGVMGRLAIAALAAAILVPAGSIEAGGPATVDLTGTVRDFKERRTRGGHSDFEKRPTHGFGLYCKNISPTLGADGNPVFVGGGNKVSSQATDSSGNPIAWTMVDTSAGDTAPSWGPVDNGGILHHWSFYSWYRDVHGRNLSAPPDCDPCGG